VVSASLTLTLKGCRRGAYKHALFQIGKHHQNIQKPQEIRFGKLSNEVSDCCLTPNEQCEELDISHKYQCYSPWFDPTRPLIHDLRTRSEHVKHYATDAVLLIDVSTRIYFVTVKVVFL
jgi:hypothetical protein